MTKENKITFVMILMVLGILLFVKEHFLGTYVSMGVALVLAQQLVEGKVLDEMLQIAVCLFCGYVLVAFFIAHEVLYSQFSVLYFMFCVIWSGIICYLVRICRAYCSWLWEKISLASLIVCVAFVSMASVCSYESLEYMLPHIFDDLTRGGLVLMIVSICLPLIVSAKVLNIAYTMQMMSIKVRSHEKNMIK